MRRIPDFFATMLAISLAWISTRVTEHPFAIGLCLAVSWFSISGLILFHFNPRKARVPLIGLAAAFFTVMGFSLSGENLEKIEYPWIHVELNYGASSGTSPEP